METTTKQLLIIFYRNPQAGKVKTRLAATVGDQKALDVFRQLSLHIRSITENLPQDKIVFYSDFMDLIDMWPNAHYLKALQQGEGLGERMRAAFDAAFETGYTSVCIIGTDCYELTSEIIGRGFDALNTADVAIGPARDGGYYLLGMNRLYPTVFENKQWSTDTVFRDTIRDFDLLGLKYVILPVLSDVDNEDDLPNELKD